MSRPTNLRRLAAAGMAAALSLLLTACLVTPGKFIATLDLRKDGQFTYSYKGEIFILGLSDLMKASQVPEKFEPRLCYADDDSEKERPCSKEELDNQRTEWDNEQQVKADKDKKDLEMAKAMLGGIDPSDPKAAEELAARLRRQHGWNAVVYKGNGLYDVDFKVSGQLSHDFSFPTMEKMPQIAPFFILNRRSDGTVRVDSPALAADQTGMSGFGNFAQMMAAEKGAGSKDNVPNQPMIDGKFVLTTDGRILANNTDEGPKADPAGQRLEWVITPRDKAGPMALIGLGK
ncbi:MAG: hypothetical protein J0M19_07580 [Sphingomonadales bacterium]|nr:hypothetical protein [Sphingomonadales bacterium]